jgi:hypothetical protein
MVRIYSIFGTREHFVRKSHHSRSMWLFKPRYFLFSLFQLHSATMLAVSLIEGMPSSFMFTSPVGRSEYHHSHVSYFDTPAHELFQNGLIDYLGCPTENITQMQVDTVKSVVNCFLVEHATLYAYLLRKQNDDPSPNHLYFHSREAAEAFVRMKGGVLKTMSFLPLSEMTPFQKGLMDLNNFETYENHPELARSVIMQSLKQSLK